MRPMGLKVGPVSALATKPYTRKSNNQGSPVKIVANAKADTMPATDLAATSFTGLGKLKIDFMDIELIANYPIAEWSTSVCGYRRCSSGLSETLWAMSSCCGDPFVEATV